MESLEEAARRVASGDTQAFRLIVNATADALVRLGARMLGSVADAEDVVQESYVKAHRALADGRFDGRSSVETWLRRIVVHAAIDAARSRARQPHVSGDVPDPSFDGGAVAEAHVALVELTELLAALPEDQRSALVLKSLEGLSSAEVADTCGCSEGAVEQRLVRARATLRERSGS